jgi:hypothetical protein
MEFHIRPRTTLGAWLSLLTGLALLLAVGVAVAVVAVGVFLFVLPALIVASLISYFYLRFRLRRAARSQSRSDIIEGEYRVVDGSARDKGQTDADQGRQ